MLVSYSRIERAGGVVDLRRVRIPECSCLDLARETSMLARVVSGSDISALLVCTMPVPSSHAAFSLISSIKSGNRILLRNMLGRRRSEA